MSTIHNSLFYVYALCEPDNFDIIRYVGKTCNTHQRLKDHLSEAKRAAFNNSKLAWIRELRANNKYPNLKVLATCFSTESAEQIEAIYIETLSAMAENGQIPPLLNEKTGFKYCLECGYTNTPKKGYVSPSTYRRYLDSGTDKSLSKWVREMQHG